MNDPRLSTDIAHLHTRLIRLERQARRAKLLAAFVALLAGATIWMAQTPLPQPPPPPPAPPPPAVAPSLQLKSLEAAEIRVVDGAGRERIVISGRDLPMITIFDSRGRTQIRMGLTARGPSLGFYDERGKYVDLAAGIRTWPLTQ